MAEGASPTNDAHGREEHMLDIDQPPPSSTKNLGKAIQADDEEHEGAAKLIPKANADSMKHIDMDDPLNSTPDPKKNQPPEILSYLKDSLDHSPSRDEGREHDPRASNCGHDDNTHTGESSTTRSTGVVRDGFTSPCSAELAKGTAAASSSMKSVIQDGPSTEENINSPLGGPSSLTPNPTKAVQDAPAREEHTLALRRPPSSSSKSRGKAIEACDQEHDEAAPSTKIIPKANAAAACVVRMQLDAGPSVRAPAQHPDGVIAPIGGPAHPNASDVASNAAPAILAIAQPDVNVEIAAIGGGVVVVGPAPAQINGGGVAVIAARPAPAQPNAARQVPAPAQINGEGVAVIAARPAPAQPNAARPVPAPAQINGGGVAVIAARPAPAQPNARGPAPNAAPPVPVLPPNPGLNNIDEALTNSAIGPLRNPADGDEGKIWDNLN